jgi:hypothetical protein
VGAVLSGVPSTAWAVGTGRSVTEGVLAAGSLVLPRKWPAPVLVAAAVPVHLALSLSWAVVLAATVPQRKAVLWATLGGAAIAALDLGVIGRRFPRIRALHQPSQIADHLAYGAAVGATLRLRERPRHV